jgi:sec-independent protein translocase protein TatB
MGDIGFSEMLVILVVAILAFGKDLPQVVRKVGRFVGKARRYLLDIKDEVQRQIPVEDFDVRDDLRKVDHDVQNAVEDDVYHPAPDPEPAPVAEPPKPETPA